MMPQTARAANNWRRRWAEDELQRFDREMTAAWRSMHATIGFAMASTGCEGAKECADEHLYDLFGDVFAVQRCRLLAALDEQGGRPDAFPWPIKAEKETA